MATVWFSITLTLPNRCCSAAIWLARCGSGAWNVAMSVAVPKPALAAGGVSWATAEPTTMAATATTISPSTSSCWRHSRRNIRHAQRITARRAGTPPLAAPEVAGRSSSTVLTGSAPG